VRRSLLDTELPPRMASCPPGRPRGRAVRALADACQRLTRRPPIAPERGAGRRDGARMPPGSWTTSGRRPTATRRPLPHTPSVRLRPYWPTTAAVLGPTGHAPMPRHRAVPRTGKPTVVETSRVAARSAWTRPVSCGATSSSAASASSNTGAGRPPARRARPQLRRRAGPRRSTAVALMISHQIVRATCIRDDCSRLSGVGNTPFGFGGVLGRCQGQRDRRGGGAS
jgi:hypothetical protein